MSLKAIVFFLAAAQAAPKPIPKPLHPIDYVSESHGLSAPHMLKERENCGLVGNFFNPTVEDWANANTDQFLADWVANNQESIRNHTQGLASAYGEWAAGNPDFACKDDGGNSCNTDNVCANPRMNGHGNQTEPAYYVYKAIDGLHSYFQGMSQSFEVAGLLGALGTDDWTRTFYKKKDGHDADDDANQNGILALKEVINALATIIAIGATFVTGPAGAAVAAGVVSAVAGGAAGAANLAIPAAGTQDSNFAHAADVGAAIGNLVKNTMATLITSNNELMQGNVVQPGDMDIQDYLQGGFFIDSSVDKVGAINTMGAMIQGMAVNQLWRKNKIFIMGGGACGDNQGIGSGPQENSWCSPDGKAWYLYFWQANDVISLTKRQWGWVNPPPGADQLGQGMFPDISVQDVISSSIDSYNVAGYNYNANTTWERTMSALSEGWADPKQKKASWEGIFSIPVCDVGEMVNQNFPGKEWILQPYGHDSRPVWCGPICKNDPQTTKDFIHAALMDGFESPKQACPDGVDFGY